MLFLETLLVLLCFTPSHCVHFDIFVATCERKEAISAACLAVMTQTGTLSNTLLFSVRISPVFSAWGVSPPSSKGGLPACCQWETAILRGIAWFNEAFRVIWPFLHKQSAMTSASAKSKKITHHNLCLANGSEASVRGSFVTLGKVYLHNLGSLPRVILAG